MLAAPFDDSFDIVGIPDEVTAVEVLDSLADLRPARRATDVIGRLSHDHHLPRPTSCCPVDDFCITRQRTKNDRGKLSPIAKLSLPPERQAEVVK
jgi:hypothetical protein